MLETKDKHIIEKQKKKDMIMAGEKSILEEFKNNLEEYMDSRLIAISQEIAMRQEVNGLNAVEINELLRPHNILGRPPTYSTKELSIIFDYYRQAIIEVNKKVMYPPTKENFCAFAGISTARYNTYLTSSDEEKQEVMLMIDDYIRENMLTSAQVGDLKEVTTMFRGKTAHGLVEATVPITINHKTDANINQIQQMIEKIKKGESLKTIELEKTKNGEYGMEE